MRTIGIPTSRALAKVFIMRDSIPSLRPQLLGHFYCFKMGSVYRRDPPIKIDEGKAGFSRNRASAATASPNAPGLVRLNDPKLAVP
jgi:hypothetical protein